MPSTSSIAEVPPLGLVPPVDERLMELRSDVIREQGAWLQELEVVRLAVEVDPLFGVHRLIQVLKRRDVSLTAPGVSGF